MDFLTDIIPAAKRKVIYAVYALVGLALASAQAGFSAAESGQPVWLTVSFAVFGVIGTAFGFTASSNINKEPTVE